MNKTLNEKLREKAESWANLNLENPSEIDINNLFFIMPTGADIALEYVQTNVLTIKE